MRAAVTLVLVSALALTASACNPAKKSEDAPGGSTAPGAGPAPKGPAAGPVASNQLPRRKPGLWETSISIKGEERGSTTRLCLDAATEARSSVWGEQASRDMCEKYEMNRQLNGSYAFASTCNMGSGGVTRSQGVASGDLTSDYTIRMKSTTSGADLEMLNRDSEFTIAARLLGPCEPGQRPGDMIMNGKVVANLNDLPGPGSATGKR